MFLSGECAAIVLHRDLDALVDADAPPAGGSRFAGWDILADLEGRESDEAESRRIAQRFVVVRLVRQLVDDELTVSRERAVEQVKRARAEIAMESGAPAEARLWHATLDALENENLEDLAATLVDLGDVVEGQGHVSGAQEIYDCAYAIAASVGSQSGATSGRSSEYVLKRESIRPTMVPLWRISSLWNRSY